MSTSKLPGMAVSRIRIPDAAYLLLILATSLYLSLQSIGILHEESGSFHRNVIALFLLISLPLLLGTPRRFTRALREHEPQRQDPFACTVDTSPTEYRFFCKGPVHDVVPGCVAFLETHFTRYVLFHSFRTPHLTFTYLAKRGTASLFALPWIRTGVGLFLLGCCLHLVHPGCVSSSVGAVLFLVLVLGFWIPGCWLLWFRPYQKLWVLLLERTGTVQVTVVCASPFRDAKRGELGRALESQLRSGSPG